MDTIQNLLDSHELIRRTVNQDEETNIISTLTWSDNPQVSDWIKVHVKQMMQRVKQDRPIRRWDPVFAALFEHADEIETSSTNTENGVAVTQEGKTECGRTLVALHSAIVTSFVERGRDAAQDSHPVPNGVC